MATQVFSPARMLHKTVQATVTQKQWAFMPEAQVNCYCCFISLNYIHTASYYKNPFKFKTVITTLQNKNIKQCDFKNIQWLGKTKIKVYMLKI